MKADHKIALSTMGNSAELSSLEATFFPNPNGYLFLCNKFNDTGLPCFLQLFQSGGLRPALAAQPSGFSNASQKTLYGGKLARS